MHEFPKTGTPTLIRPRPGRAVLKEGGAQHMQGAAVFPWSHYWQVMAAAGAIEFHVLPPWGAAVIVRETKGGEWVRRTWTQELASDVIAGILSPPLTEADADYERLVELLIEAAPAAEKEGA